MKKSILFTACFSLAAITALLFAGCGDKGTESGSEKWEGDVDHFLQTCCGGTGVTHKYDTLADGRDGKKYKTIAIGGKTWMAENLNYRTPDSSWCYDNDTSNCRKYGRLYAWNAATEACPKGWHLSTGNEWAVLEAAAGGMAGKKLKSSRGWSDPNFYCTGSGCEYIDIGTNGTDIYGFSALPGGYGYSYSYSVGFGFNTSGSYGYWWTEAGRRVEISYNNDISSYSASTGSAYSVRCVKD